MLTMLLYYNIIVMLLTKNFGKLCFMMNLMNLSPGYSTSATNGSIAHAVLQEFREFCDPETNIKHIIESLSSKGSHHAESLCAILHQINDIYKDRQGNCCFKQLIFMLLANINQNTTIDKGCNVHWAGVLTDNSKYYVKNCLDTMEHNTIHLIKSINSLVEFFTNGNASLFVPEYQKLNTGDPTESAALSQILDGCTQYNANLERCIDGIKTIILTDTNVIFRKLRATCNSCNTLCNKKGKHQICIDLALLATNKQSTFMNPILELQSNPEI